MSFLPGRCVTMMMLACSLFAGPTLAGEINVEGQLAKGDSTLESGEFWDAYEIQVEAGEFVTIDMVSDDFDTYLSVRFPNEEMVEDDDSGGSLNARLTFVAPVAGVYTVIATSAAAEETGAYTVVGNSVTLVPLKKEKGALTEDDQVSVKTGEYVDISTIELAANEKRVIELYSDAFDTYLVVYTPDGELLYNDDSSTEGASFLVIEAGAQGGSFTVVATSFMRGETGAYRLTYWSVAE